MNKVPFKVLDAPDLTDDFYLNLVDWGSSNILGVGLGSAVYMWDSINGHVTKLCQLEDDTVTSVNWIQRVRLHSSNANQDVTLTQILHKREHTLPLGRVKGWFRFGMPSTVADYGR